MLHQIRKMVGLTIAILRGFATRETLDKAFKMERVDIPIAPSLNLLLEQVKLIVIPVNVFIFYIFLVVSLFNSHITIPITNATVMTQFTNLWIGKFWTKKWINFAMILFYPLFTREKFKRIQ